MKPSFDNHRCASNPAITIRRRRPGLGAVTFAGLLLALFALVPIRAQVVITEFVAAAEYSIVDQTPSLPVPDPANDATRKKQIPIRRSRQAPSACRASGMMER